MKKKNVPYFIACLILVILVLYLFKLQNSSLEKIHNSTSVCIGYGYSSHMALIDKKEEVSGLEEIFNKAKFTESDTAIQFPYLSITFQTNNGTTRFHIDENGIIETENDKYIKSEDINFKDLYTIFEKN
ncbi:hypothetical protein AN1V17_02490 [Vallitalea sediminicola]